MECGVYQTELDASLAWALAITLVTVVNMRR
jgi:hypothetical protein